MSSFKHIVERLPYSKPFLFVDEILRMDEEGCEGFYTFRKDEFFYQGHFTDHAVTPGVILIECMAQVGLVCLGIFISLQQNSENKPSFTFSESQAIFLHAVYPGEKVRVVSRKKYWRLGKLKCDVEMYNEAGTLVCRATLSGMMLKNKN